MIAIALLIIGFGGALFTYDSLTKAGEVIEERIFTETVHDITIASDNAVIEVVPTNEDTTKVEWIGNGRNDSSYRFDAVINDGILQVEAKEKILQFFNFDFFKKSTTLKIHLPEQEYEVLDVKTGNGKIEITDMTANKLLAKSENGMMTFNNLHTQQANFQSDNGKIDMINVEGDLDVEVINGMITMKTESLNQPVHLESVNGKINVQVDEEPTNAEIFVEVTNGTVDVFGENNQHTVFGDGAYRIHLKTVNGQVDVGY